MAWRLWVAGWLFAAVGTLYTAWPLGQYADAADGRPSLAAKATPAKGRRAEPASKDAQPEPVALPNEVYSTGYDGRDGALLQFINQQIRQGWVENYATPSAPADDGEWLRRVSLDIVGKIPDLKTAEAFLADTSTVKRTKLIESLLEDPAYARNFTTIWTNLLIGRVTPRDINRPALQKFLRESFGRNRGWNAIVTDLLTAEGPNNTNGATNFLLAHLNDGAVPATAISSRLFLGTQVQCTQCHNHPFNPALKQNAFWEFNSFFKQVRSQRVQKYNEKSGRNEVEYLELTARDFEGPVFFERRNGLMEVAYPKFNDVEVSPDATLDRRHELAKLITTGQHTQLADAMVNRMWGHFFGYGFTRPVDEMGPPNSPSHPALLERLSIEFVKSGYDLKRLIGWICNSEAYNLTSRFNAHNEKDNPAAGEMPVFSHLYLKSMQAEQLYDSLIVATGAHNAAGGDWEKAESRRQEWMQQFVRAFGTDENDESSTFDGTIPQALMLMNGELMKAALEGARGSVLHSIMYDKTSPSDKVRQLYLAALSRAPSAKEVQTANRILKHAASPLEAYQDLYWALLNSNEFIINH